MTVRGSAIPPDFVGNLNDLWQAMLNRLEIISPFGEVNLRIGGLMPTTNVGLWLNGKQLWVWDEVTKAYIPLDVSASVNITGSITTALIGYATEVYVNSQIAAAFAAATPVVLPKFSAYLDVTVPVDVVLPGDPTKVKVTFTKTNFDVGVGLGHFDKTLSRFVVPTAGYYYFSGSLRFDFNSADAYTGLNAEISILVNGNIIAQFEESLGAMRYGTTIGYSAYAQLNPGDYVEVWAAMHDGLLTGIGQVTNDGRKSYFSGFKTA